MTVQSARRHLSRRERAFRAVDYNPILSSFNATRLDRKAPRQTARTRKRAVVIGDSADRRFTNGKRRSK